MTNPTPLEHSRQAPRLPDASAPWWEDGYTISPAHAEPGFLAKGINAFCQRIKGCYYRWPSKTRSPARSPCWRYSLGSGTSAALMASRSRFFASGSSSPL